jgi:hypothetical protein
MTALPLERLVGSGLASAGVMLEGSSRPVSGAGLRASEARVAALIRRVVPRAPAARGSSRRVIQAA